MKPQKTHGEWKTTQNKEAALTEASKSACLSLEMLHDVSGGFGYYSFAKHMKPRKTQVEWKTT